MALTSSVTAARFVEVLNPQNRFRLESALFLLLGCLFVTLSQTNNWLISIDRLIYDLTIANSPAPRYEDLVIVAIDDHSLHELGPWPWPREKQAELIGAVAAFAPQVIAVDIVYAGETASDHHLVKTVSQIDGFAAPLIMDTTFQGGQHIEVMPFPDLAERTDILGHVQIEFDDDAIVRGTYLYQGIGRPVWPHLMIGIADKLGFSVPAPCTRPAESALIVAKCGYLRIPFAGPPSSYPEVSASLLLENPGQNRDLLKRALQDKVVLVGAMAYGVGDWITSPLGDEVTPLSGVEI